MFLAISEVTHMMIKKVYLIRNNNVLFCFSPLTAV